MACETVEVSRPPIVSRLVVRRSGRRLCGRSTVAPALCLRCVEASEWPRAAAASPLPTRLSCGCAVRAAPAPTSPLPLPRARSRSVAWPPFCVLRVSRFQRLTAHRRRRISALSLASTGISQQLTIRPLAPCCLAASLSLQHLTRPTTASLSLCSPLCSPPALDTPPGWCRSNPPDARERYARSTHAAQAAGTVDGKQSDRSPARLLRGRWADAAMQGVNTKLPPSISMPPFQREHKEMAELSSSFSLA